MRTKKKAASTTPSPSATYGKGCNSSRNIKTVRKLFLSGSKFTAKQLNALVGFNDARKSISVLRHKEGWKIVDCRLPGGCKLYWLAKKGGSRE